MVAEGESVCVSGGESQEVFAESVNAAYRSGRESLARF